MDVPILPLSLAISVFDSLLTCQLGKVHARVNGVRKRTRLQNFESFDAKNIVFLEIIFKSVRILC